MKHKWLSLNIIPVFGRWIYYTYSCSWKKKNKSSKPQTIKNKPFKPRYKSSSTTTEESNRHVKSSPLDGLSDLDKVRKTLCAWCPLHVSSLWPIIIIITWSLIALPWCLSSSSSCQMLVLYCSFFSLSSVFHQLSSLVYLSLNLIKILWRITQAAIYCTANLYCDWVFKHRHRDVKLLYLPFNIPNACSISILTQDNFWLKRSTTFFLVLGALNGVTTHCVLG